MTPDDAARVQQVARVLAEGGLAADTMRGLLRMALGPVPLPRLAPPELQPGACAESDETAALRAFDARFPGVMRGWFK
jgi:hypothetical protein